MSKQGIKDNWDLVEKWTFHGAAIQFYLDDTGEWLDILDSNILWEEDIKYREKPEPTELEKALDMVEAVCKLNAPVPAVVTKEAFRVVYEHEKEKKKLVTRKFEININGYGEMITSCTNSTRLFSGEKIKVIEVIEQ